MEKKVGYFFKIEPSLREALHDKARRYGLSESALIREAVANYFRDYGRDGDVNVDDDKQTSRVALDYLTWITLRTEIVNQRSEIRATRDELKTLSAALNASVDLDDPIPNFNTLALVAERLKYIQQTMDECLEVLTGMKDSWAPVSLLGHEPEEYVPVIESEKDIKFLAMEEDYEDAGSEVD